MSETGKHLVPYQKNAVAVVGRQLDITDRLLKERALALMVDKFNVPVDGTFEEAVQRVRPDGLITIDAGRYALEAGVTITKPLRIMGAGRDLTVISSSVKGTILSVETDGLFVMENVGVLKTGEDPGNIISVSAKDVVLKCCSVTGNNYKSDFDDLLSGIRVSNCEQGLIEDSVVTNCDFGIFILKTAVG